MTSTFLIANPNSVKTRSNGPALADIRLVINGRDFPSHDWNDFVVVVLGWWAHALVRLLGNVGAKETVNFMDGPYAVEIVCASPEILRFHVRGGGLENEVGVGEALIGPFIQELIVQSRGVLDECKRQNWWSKDADILLSSLEALT